MPNPYPKSSKPELPFAIDAIDFSVWLESLSVLDEIECSAQILHVLQTLNNAYPAENNSMPGKTRLFFLSKLGATLFEQADWLAVRANNANAISLNPDDSEADSPLLVNNGNSISELSAHIYSELANGYILLSKEANFKRKTYYSLQQKSLILFCGLQAMGKTLLHISQTYARPHPHFWLKCFQLYQLAQRENLTQKESTEDTITAKAQSIDNIFKLLLIFSLSNTNQFSPQEMVEIYDLLGKFSGYAKLLPVVPEKKFKGIPCIHLDKDLPPAISIIAATQKDDEHTLYIATVRVVEKILEASSTKTLNHSPADRLMLTRLAKTLTMNQQRKQIREQAKGEHFGIIGFDNLFHFLHLKELKNENAAAIDKNLSLIRPDEPSALNFEILVNEESPDDLSNDDFKSERAAYDIAYKETTKTNDIEHIDSADIWNITSQEQFKTNIKLIDKSESGYGIIWENKEIQPKIGDIIGLKNKDLSIGIIRRIFQLEESVAINLGIELLGYNAQTVKISNPGYPDVQVDAIYLPNEDPIKPSESVILLNSEFRPDEFVFILIKHRNIRYRLTKQLHSTVLINHLAITRIY